MNIIKKVSIVVLCCIFIFSNFIYAIATFSPEVIKIGYVENWGVICSKTEHSQTGYGFEYFEELSKYSGHKYEYIPIEWEDLSQLLDDGEIDLFTPIAKTEKRFEMYEYSNHPFGYEEILLTASKDSDIIFDDIDTIDNASIGILENSDFLIQYLDKYLAKNDINADIKPYAGSDGLKNGDYELELTGSFLDEDDRQVVAKLGTAPLYSIAEKGNVKLIEELNTATAELSNDNIFFELNLNKKYFGNSEVTMPNLSKSDRLLLEEKGNSFTVLISPDHEPLQYINDDGIPDGILIELLELISDDSGIVFNYVFETEATLVDYDEVDISINSLHNDFLNSDYITTDLYFELPMMLVGKIVNDPTDIESVGMLDYYAIDTKLFNVVDIANINLYQTFEEMAELMKKGYISHIIATNIASTYLLEVTGLENHSVYPVEQNLPLEMMVSSELSEYVEIFDKLIARIDQDKLQAILVKHTSAFVPDKSIFDFILINPLATISSISIVALIILAAVILMHRQKKRFLYEIINKDDLTGLITTRRFHELAKKLLLTASPNEYILISFDIDNFQYINEAYGYEYGSNVLKSLGKQLAINYAKDSLVTREKDDKFLILTLNKLPTLTACGKTICENCVSTTLSEILGIDYKSSRSQGVYLIYNPSESLEYMIDCTHSARLLGKQNYGDTCFEFTEDMRLARKTKNIIVSTMEKALKSKEFSVFYQPKVELKESLLSGAEALVRWFPSDGSMIFPDNFIPLFEENGFIVNLDYYVFEEVCDFIHRWEDKLTIPEISVNLSGVTLLDNELVEKLTNITKKYKLNNNMLELEITESAIVRNFEEAILKIALLKEAGFIISLDDFGSGMSSLNRLKDINIDVLKIDREFLTANLSNAKGISIIKNIIKMSKEIDILTIAEGVETKEHVDFLQNLECDFAQGYYFGKPMIESDFVDIIINGFNSK